MQKLNHLSIALKTLGLAAESNQIQKLARGYVQTVAEEGTSKRFYQVARAIDNEVYHWRSIVTPYLVKEAGARNPEATNAIILTAINSCLYNWSSNYVFSIGSKDTFIPPWLFQLLETKVMPFLKESFSRQIDALPADSKTKRDLQTWLSRNILEQLGASNITEVLDSGEEFWSNFLSNAIHEIHHNILNHSAWKRFSAYGVKSSNYNYLDALEEGVVSAIKPGSRHQEEEKIWQELYEAIADFLEPMFVDTFKDSEFNHIGQALYQDWSLVYQHLDEIKAEEMGVKFPEQKITFLEEVFDTFYRDSLDNGEYLKIHNWFNFKKLMISAIKKVWSSLSPKNYNQPWDFLTGDDEDLLINLMKDLDSRADELWGIWENYKEELYNLSNEEVKDCIDAKIQDYMNQSEEAEETESDVYLPL